MKARELIFWPIAYIAEGIGRFFDGILKLLEWEKDVQALEAIEYPNSKDLQSKIIHREEQIEQALKDSDGS